MSKGRKIVTAGGTGQITEKKSRFIAQVQPVNSEEEALKFINEVKKKYWDARHNCYAFTIGDRFELTRSSDDGEPSGTAGKPILEILLKEEIHNCAIVVTRYFGGTLLGTGGLIRAYQGAALEGLKESTIGIKHSGFLYTVQCDYNSFGKIQHLFAEKEIHPLSIQYTDSVTCDLALTDAQSGLLLPALTEITAGKAHIRKESEADFLLTDSGVILL